MGSFSNAKACRWGANASQRTGEILRDGALEGDAFATRRVHERQPLRVEGEPVKTELGAITAVVSARRWRRI
jgi:hypothetical protein